MTAPIHLPTYGEADSLQKRRRLAQVAMRTLAVSLAPGERGATAPPIRGSVPEDPNSFTPWRTFDEAGLRFTRAVTPGLPTQPVRAFAGLKNGDSASERVDTLIREMERTGAFTRSNIAVVVTTGGGHVNPAVVESLERMTDGDSATVAMQYGTLPSAASFMKIGDAVKHYDLLLRRIKDRIDQLHPNGGGPKVLLYGESLGAWVGREIIRRRGPDALDTLGVDRALWVGVPGMSQPDKARGKKVVAGTIAQLRAETGSDTRIVSYTHFDDPVGTFQPSLLWDSAALDTPVVDARTGQRMSGKKKSGSWLPLVSFVRVGVNLIQSTQKERVGPFEAKGHDYRGSIPELVRTGFGLPAADGSMKRIQDAVAKSNAWVLDTDWSPDNKELAVNVP
jgi:uncharacterized membrane protein